VVGGLVDIPSARDLHAQAPGVERDRHTRTVPSRCQPRDGSGICNQRKVAPDRAETLAKIMHSG
jgi:hypothetical protein